MPHAIAEEDIMPRETTEESITSHATAGEVTAPHATEESSVPDATGGTATLNAAGNSSSWSSPRTLEGARLARYQSMATHLGIYHSPFFPKNIGEYASHLNAVHGEKLEIEQGRIRVRILELRALDEWGQPLKLGEFLNGKILEYKRVDAMGMKRERIWPFGTTRPEEEKNTQIGWPSKLEAKIDGECRARQGLERRLPVPKRRVDSDTAARLMNYGMPVEMAMELLNASEGEVEDMMRDALDSCGLDEFAWKKIEAEMIRVEEQYQAWVLRHRRRLYVNAWENAKEKEGADHVTKGGLRFDEQALSKCGAWGELLRELNRI
jgi:hypothetical protein